jgi:hypothetical protein
VIILICVNGIIVFVVVVVFVVQKLSIALFLYFRDMCFVSLLSPCLLCDCNLGYSVRA